MPWHTWDTATCLVNLAMTNLPYSNLDDILRTPGFLSAGSLPPLADETAVSGRGAVIGTVRPDIDDTSYLK